MNNSKSLVIALVLVVFSFSQTSSAYYRTTAMIAAVNAVSVGFGVLLSYYANKKEEELAPDWEKSELRVVGHKMSDLGCVHCRSAHGHRFCEPHKYVAQTIYEYDVYVNGTIQTKDAHSGTICGYSEHTLWQRVQSQNPVGVKIPIWYRKDQPSTWIYCLPKADLLRGVSTGFFFLGGISLIANGIHLAIINSEGSKI